VTSMGITPNPVLLFAVDESVLELAGYSIIDPLLTFFSTHHSISSGSPSFFSQIAIRDLSYLPGEIPDEIPPTTQPPAPKQKLQDAIVRDSNFRESTKLYLDVIGKGEELSLGGKRMKVEEQCEELELEKNEDGIFGGVAASATVASPAKVLDRKDFDPLCTFQAGYTTADGTLSVDFKVKDNLTRYR
jgi:hypothetical protein